ncbi:MAG TPA: CARDB domain-containing protein [Thermoleophilaceae bacterium]
MLATALLLGALASPARAAVPAVKIAECRTGKAPEMRLATFAARMRGGKNVARMAMRFQLLERTPGAEAAHPVAAPELAPWRKSRVGVRDFSYAQTIKGLSSGVTYSVLVQFRYYNARGKVVRREERESGTCVQDGALPNLVLGAVRLAPGSTEKTAVYSVSVGNTGQGEAKSVPVSLIADGALVDTRTIDLLQAGEFTTVKFTGPHCSRLRAIVDRAEVVPETVEEDNELRARC